MDLNPYQPPCGVLNPNVDRSPPPSSQAVFQALAAVLLFGGVMWGLLCLFFVLLDPLRGLVIFGPGYVITVGYFCRTFLSCSLAWRKAIWIASFVVQGTWLGVALADERAGTVFGIWWLVSTLISLAGVIWDGPERKPSCEVKI